MYLNKHNVAIPIWREVGQVVNLSYRGSTPSKLLAFQSNLR
jgi:hypothetical protein